MNLAHVDKYLGLFDAIEKWEFVNFYAKNQAAFTNAMYRRFAHTFQAAQRDRCLAAGFDLEADPTHWDSFWLKPIGVDLQRSLAIKIDPSGSQPKNLGTYTVALDNYRLQLSGETAMAQLQTGNYSHLVSAFGPEASFATAHAYYLIEAPFNMTIDHVGVLPTNRDERAIYFHLYGPVLATRLATRLEAFLTAAVCTELRELNEVVRAVPVRGVGV